MTSSIGDLSDSDILNTVLLEHIYDNVTITDCNGILLRVSKSCEQNFHFRREDYVGKPIALMEAHGIFSQMDRTGVCRPITGIPVFDEVGALKILAPGAICSWYFFCINFIS